MKLTQLNSTKIILERVKKHDGLLTWYNIVKYVDQKEEAEKDPPVFAVLKELNAEGFLFSNTTTAEGLAIYSITEAGSNFLNSLN
jgi:DNA-binding PadR family transcriptional regulator